MQHAFGNLFTRHVRRSEAEYIGIGHGPGTQACAQRVADYPADPGGGAASLHFLWMQSAWAEGIRLEAVKE